MTHARLFPFLLSILVAVACDPAPEDGETLAGQDAEGLDVGDPDRRLPDAEEAPGLYGPAPHRGPFVHADTRGFEARW